MKMMVANHTWINSTGDSSVPHDLHLMNQLTAVFGVLQIVLGSVLNVLLLVTLLSEWSLRRDVRNMLVASLAMADLLTALVLQPILVTLVFRGDWSLHCQTYVSVQLLYLYAVDYVGVWGMVTLDALLLARLCRQDMPSSSFLTSHSATSISRWKRRVDRAVVVGVVTLPWVLSVLIITPIVFDSLLYCRDLTRGAPECDFLLKTWAHNFLFLFLFCLPFPAIFVLLSISGYILWRGRREGSVQTTTPSMSPSITSLSGEPALSQDRPSAYVTASVLTFFLIGPRHLLPVLSSRSVLPEDSNAGSEVTVTFVMQWLSEVKAVVLPLVWLLMLPRLRARARHLLCLGKKVILRVKDSAGFDPSVSYRDLEA